ncbi:hypothetical protein TRFO_08937 [Tritrichomonas foetus]|uniref:Uncharacterized protein n=1 Tax=Tritrichomonas foetus TaxID=1144522 RepID=A0A1J4JGP5_9EUKA|nr:hypothetical protein TRFO_08937 [Tritrichomonas foetus]|eukprot:OHS98350.1 hypothetical protein TRFO_08937 [Tritrichomonas foetus]
MKTLDAHNEEDESQFFNEMELNFISVVQELIGDPALDKFRDEYEKLNDSLVESHEHNSALIERCRQLNQDIHRNADKIATVLSISKNDNKTIALLRSEFERAWKMVEMTNEREEKSKDVIYSLNEEIKNLRYLVEQSKNPEFLEISYQSAKGDVDQLRKEIKTNEYIIKSINDEIDHTRQITHEKIDLTKNLEDDEMNEIEESEKLDNEIQNIRDLKKEINQESDKRNEIIKNQKNKFDSIIEQKKETKKRMKSIQSEIQSKKVEMEVISEKTAHCIFRRKKREKDLKRVQKRTEYTQREFDMVKEQYDKVMEKLNFYQKDLGSILSENEKNLEEYSIEHQHSAELSEAHNLIITKKKQMGNELFHLKTKITASDLKIRGDRNEIGLSNIEARNLVNEYAKEATETKVAAKESVVAERQVNETRGINEGQKKKVYSVSEEVRNNEQNSKSLKISTEIMKKGQIEIQKQLDELSGELSKFYDDIKRQEALNDLLRDEKVVIIRQLEKIKGSNESIQSEAKSINILVDKLKDDLKRSDQDLIEKHLQTELTKKEIKELAEEVETFRKQKEDLLKADARLVEEIHKCSAVTTEAAKDIEAKKVVIDDIVRQNRYLQKKVSTKRLESSEMFEKNRVVESELKMAQKRYSSKNEEVNKLKQELIQESNKISELIQKVQFNDNIHQEIKRLEKKLIEVETQRKVLENEYESPRFIHRWHFLESTNPELMELIRLHTDLVDRIWVEIAKKDRAQNKKAEVKKKADRQLKHLQQCQCFESVESEVKRLKKLLKEKDNELDILKSQLGEKKPLVENENRVLSSVRQMIRETKIETAAVTIGLRQLSPMRSQRSRQFSTARMQRRPGDIKIIENSSSGDIYTYISEPPVVRPPKTGRFYGGGFAMGNRKTPTGRIHKNVPTLDLNSYNSVSTSVKSGKVPIFTPKTERKTSVPKRMLYTPGHQNRTRQLRSARVPHDDL